MKKLARPLALVVAGALLGWSGATLAGDEKEAPPAVTAAVEKAYPGAKITEVDEEELELEAFEVEVKAGEQDVELVVAPDGTVVTVEREATTEELPAAVKERMAKLGGTVGDVARVERRAQLQVVALPAPVTTWEVTVVRKGEGAGRFEVLLGDDGAVLGEERDDDHDDADDHDDHDDDADKGGSRMGR